MISNPQAIRSRATCTVIEVQVGELKQLFNSIDPSAFRSKELDSDAEEFIVGWAKDLLYDAEVAQLAFHASVPASVTQLIRTGIAASLPIEQIVRHLKRSETVSRSNR